MFPSPNGGGIRNMFQTVNWYTRCSNSYGTRLPAGAYVSLDPAQDPDTSVLLQVTTHIQNVLTFGTGCTGLRVDGSLHNAGNRSSLLQTTLHRYYPTV